jgi:hypothetical protein
LEVGEKTKHAATATRTANILNKAKDLMRDLLFGLGVESAQGSGSVSLVTLRASRDDLELLYVLLIYAGILGKKVQEIALV